MSLEQKEQALPLSLPAAGNVLRRLLEAGCVALLVADILILLLGVFMRYVLNEPLAWGDEVALLLFSWLTMLGAALAINRHEHLKMTVVLNYFPPRIQSQLDALATSIVLLMTCALLLPSYERMLSEAFMTTSALQMPASYKAAAMPVGLILMAMFTANHLLTSRTLREIVIAWAVIGVAAGILFTLTPIFTSDSSASLIIILAGLTALCLALGVPIAFCFGFSTLAFFYFATDVPISVIVGRVEDGMSGMVLLSVPVFILLGCVLDVTGIGQAIVKFVSTLVGHLKGGMSYVLLGSMFLVSGISGSKVSDMATVAPALFPEMARRGHKPKEMVSLLAAGAAMADTVPPSIVLIVLGSIAGVSIGALFTSGIVIALILLFALAVLARIKARHETPYQQRSSLQVIWKALLFAAPAVTLPFVIRGAVGGGVATATEVAAIAVIYGMLIGATLYGGMTLSTIYKILLETVIVSGVVLLIIGMAAALAWTITQSGFAFRLAELLTGLPGGWITFMFVSIAVFIVLGCILEGLPAIVLLAPIMFPIASNLDIDNVHYSMVIITAMNIGLIMPPFGIGYYIACKMGRVSPAVAMVAIWPYILALLIGLLAIALIPAISIGYL